MSNFLANIPMYQIAQLWKAASHCRRGAARNAAFWECVRALESQGFTGNARSFLERVAPWA